jgi:Cyclin
MNVVSPISSSTSFLSKQAQSRVPEFDTDFNLLAQEPFRRTLEEVSYSSDGSGNRHAEEHILCFTDLDFVKRYTKLPSLLCETSRLGDYLPDRQNKISIFYSSGRQTFSLESYVTRILTFTQCSRSIFITSAVYMDRLKRSEPILAASKMSIHRIFITAVNLAMKFVQDDAYANKFLAKVGGIETVA